MIAFVPIPPGDVAVMEHVWLPFVEKIAERGGESVSQLAKPIEQGLIGLAVAWDSEAKKALALMGFQTRPRGYDLVGEIIWLTGSDMGLWLSLYDDMERFFREHLGCAALRPICRPGWSKILKSKGYRMTHVVMERELR